MMLIFAWALLLRYGGWSKWKTDLMAIATAMEIVVPDGIVGWQANV